MYIIIIIIIFLENLYSNIAYLLLFVVSSPIGEVKPNYKIFEKP